jgi:hypothetical protein
MEVVVRALSRIQHHLRLEQIVQVGLLELELDRPLLDPLDVEQVVQQFGEPAGLRSDHFEVPPHLLRRQLAVEHQRREAEHARERRPELVRDVADELALRLFALEQAYGFALRDRRASARVTPPSS